ncbi:MAG: cytochrome c [Pseudorhodoplanes sp.]
MLRRLLVAMAVAAALAAGLFWLATVPATVAVGALGPHAPDLENGKTLFFAGGCASCHATPGQEDATRLGGGLALKSPFGTFHVPNISPDRTDGIGAWSEADFVTAMQKGTSPDGRHYYPAFPYTSYQRMRVGDLRDLFAYLQTLAPVQGRVRDHALPFPFNVRRAVGLWKRLYLDGRPFAPDPARDAAWNRGAYLVNGPGHCAECHSPRDRLGGIVTRQRLAGGPDPAGEGWVPNITQAGLRDWSEDDIAQFLEFGDKPDGRPILGSMVPVIRNTSQLPAGDRAAMAAYVKSLTPVEGPKRPGRR